MAKRVAIIIELERGEVVTGVFALGREEYEC